MLEQYNTNEMACCTRHMNMNDGHVGNVTYNETYNETSDHDDDDFVAEVFAHSRGRWTVDDIETVWSEMCANIYDMSNDDVDDDDIFIWPTVDTVVSILTERYNRNM